MLNRYQTKTIQFALTATATLALASGCSTPDEETAAYSGYSYSSPYTPANVSSSTDQSTSMGASADQSATTSGSSSSSSAAATTPANLEQTGENIVIPLFKEELRVGTRKVDAGSVQLRKTVETETVNQPVQIRRESVSIDREPASGEAATQAQDPSLAQSGQNLGQPFQEGEMEIRLQREEVFVEKQVVPSGRIVAQKSAEIQQTNVQGQVRREDIDVSKSGDAQNVMISQNVTGSAQGNEAMGAAGDSGGQMQGGTGPSGPVTDINRLLSDPSSLQGHSVRLSGVQVQEISGSNLVALKTGGKPVYIRLAQPQQLKAGQTVSVTGTIRPVSAATTAQLGLSAQEQQALQGQQFYIDAQKVEPANQ